MKKLLLAIPSKQLLIVAAIILACLLIWFAGPYLSFGGLHPFASISMRLTMIILIMALVLFFLQRWPMSILGVTAACLLIWHAGPLLTIGAIQPLSSLWIRIPLLTAIIGTYAVFGLAPLWQNLGLHNTLLKRVFKNPSDNVAKNELKMVNSIIQHAMAQLKHIRSSSSGLRRLFEGRRYLYELPWYMIIGTPGAGKTTALINSGMQFPLAEQMQASANTLTHAGQGGTTHCDWWFTNDAVLIDTAGRYSSQEMNKVKDNAEWHGFLSMIRKRRSQSPINGAVVAISMADFLTQTEEERIKHAQLLRERLIELRQELGIRFPIYIMVTKMDLLEGFSEYFHHLASEDLSQVWGFTLPYLNTNNTKWSKKKNTEQAAVLPLKQQLKQEFTTLEQRLEDGLILRLREEFDKERRRTLYALPQEFSGMTEALAQMIDAIFADSRFDQTQVNQGLRGVYFTSAAQAATSIPANKMSLLQRMRRAFSGDKSQQHDPANLLPSHKRSYFLSQLFTQIIIPDANLVRPNLRWELRFRLLRLASHIGISAAALWLISALVFSFDKNDAYLTKVAAKVAAFRPTIDNIERRATYQNVPALSEALTIVNKLPQTAEFDITRPPGSVGYGLYSAPAIIEASEHLYAQMQETLLIPQFVHYLETVLEQAIATKNVNLAYDTLRIYLQLHQRDRFNAADMKSWAEQDWQLTQKASLFGPQSDAMRHLIKLFSSQRVVQSTTTPKTQLIHQVRTLLDSSSSMPHLYRSMKQRLLHTHPGHFSLSKAIGTEADTLFKNQSGQLLDQRIPVIFTYAGFHDIVQPAIDGESQRALDEQAWIMGKEHALPASEALVNNLRTLYLKDYASQWKAYLNEITIASNHHLDGDMMVLKMMIKSSSPLVLLARTAAHETTLSVDISIDTPHHLFARIASQVNRSLQDEVGTSNEDQQMKTFVDNQFTDLRDFVTGNSAMYAAQSEEIEYSPEGFVQLLQEYYKQLVTAESAVKSNNLPAERVTAANKIILLSGKLPAPVKSLVTQLIQQTMQQLDEAAAVFIRPQAEQEFNKIAASLAPVSLSCRANIEGHYPFADSYQDTALSHFKDMFAPGSTTDTFFKNFLAPYVDTTGMHWQYKKPDAIKGDSPEDTAVKKEVLRMLKKFGPNPDDFAKVYALQKLFFVPGNSEMSFSTHVQVSELDPTIAELIINIDGQTQRYAHGPQIAKEMKWPGPRGGILAELTTPNTDSNLLASGPWALYRLLEKAKTVQRYDSTYATFKLGNHNTTLKLNATVPLNRSVFQQFTCPRGIE